MHGLFVILLALLAVEVLGSASFKTYSFLAPNVVKERNKLISKAAEQNAVEYTHKSHQKGKNVDTHVFSIEVPDAISDSAYSGILLSEGRALSSRLASMESVIKDSKTKCSLNKDALIASIKNKWIPFGWTTYGLIRCDDHSSLSTSQSNTAGNEREVVIRVCDLHSNGGDDSCLIELKATFREDRTVQCIVECSSTLTKSDRKVLLAKLREVWKERVINTLLVIATRVQQHKKYQEESQDTLKRKRERQLDKILNPDNYKSQSPTVRRTGSGKYDPSRGARERMQAKRQTRVVRRGGG